MSLLLSLMIFLMLLYMMNISQLLSTMDIYLILSGKDMSLLMSVTEIYLMMFNTSNGDKSVECGTNVAALPRCLRQYLLLQYK